MDPHSDESLFEPTLGAHRMRSLTRSRPWRLQSQGYVSFFGGPLAAALVGVLNGRRLGLSSSELTAIAVAGVIAFGAAAALIVATGGGEGPRLVVNIAGMLTYAVSRQLQKAADYRWRVGRTDDEAYEPLLRPGLAIVFGAGIVSALVVVGLMS